MKKLIICYLCTTKKPYWDLLQFFADPFDFIEHHITRMRRLTTVVENGIDKSDMWPEKCFHQTHFEKIRKNLEIIEKIYTDLYRLVYENKIVFKY